MSKKSRKEQAPGAHAFLEFQAEVKRKEITEVEQLIKELEDKNRGLVELRDQLREENQEKWKVLYDQMKEKEKQLLEKKLVNQDQSRQAVKDNLKFKRIQDEELTELKRKLASVQEQAVERQAYMEQLCTNVDNTELQQRIQNLEEELVLAEKKLQGILGHIEHTYEEDISKIDSDRFRVLNEELLSAKREVIKKVQQQQRQDLIRGNEWLKKEIDIYQKEISELEVDVKNLEEENLELVKELLDYRLNNFQISSNTFLTQGPDLEHQLSLSGKAAEIGKKQHQQSGELEEDEMDPSCKPSSSSSSSSLTHHLKTLQFSSQSNPREPLHLDLLEQRMLCVVGQAMPLYPLPEELDTTHLGLFQAQDETFTTTMIRKHFE